MAHPVDKGHHHLYPVLLITTLFLLPPSLAYYLSNKKMYAQPVTCKSTISVSYPNKTEASNKHITKCLNR